MEPLLEDYPVRKGSSESQTYFSPEPTPVLRATMLGYSFPVAAVTNHHKPGTLK